MPRAAVLAHRAQCLERLATTMSLQTELHTSTDPDVRFWDRIARKYAASKIRDAAGYERSLERTARLLCGADTVLELGCGTGSTALRLAGDVARYRATDISPGMVDIARDKLAATPCPGLSFDVATAESLLAEGKEYDAVLGFNFLHLGADVERTLESIRRLVRPGGVFVAKTPCLKDMNRLVRLAVPVMQFFGKAPHVAFFSARELERMIADAGFAIEAVESHAGKGRDVRPFIIARRLGGADRDGR